MRPFSELTELGRLRRLRRFAEEVAVSHYGMTKPRVRLLSHHTFNTMFRVDTDAGRFVLRVGDETRIHTSEVEEVEAHWLLRLESSEITAPVPIPSLKGSWRVDHETKDVSGKRACSMFSFVEGRELRRAGVDAAAIRRAGELLARLHENAASAPPMSTSPLLRADRVVYFHEKNLVSDYRPDGGNLFEEAIDRVQNSINFLWQSPPHPPHLLHGDFGTNNVMTWRNQLRPIDFQDLQLGFDLQDVGITLADFSRNAPELCAPFQEGYGSIRPLPEISPDLLATLAAGRSLNLMNLGLHLRRQGIERFLDGHGKFIRQWMHGR